jgi:hypothetical protein
VLALLPMMPDVLPDAWLLSPKMPVVPPVVTKSGVAGDEVPMPTLPAL